ncbi:hypothetical protein DH2020_029717 [Rehmannia glutinosa]|uniref:NAC domain-containing protein n=1 Tax=Rehmannia glutinosa TaxID=99300 RepID=A0ABR0VRD0_REHGL
MEAGVGPYSSLVNHHEKEELDHELLASLELPPGFRFHPTDEEIIIYYLLSKVIDRRFSAIAIGEVDLNKCEPWDLPNKGKMGEKEWFFFCQKDRKYPTGMRTNRATESGYWKATGKDKEIYMKGRKWLVGMKKDSCFLQRESSQRRKPIGSCMNSDLRATFLVTTSLGLQRVSHKKTKMKTNVGVQVAKMDSFVDHLMDLDSPTLPQLTHYSCSTDQAPSPSFATDKHEFTANSINHQSQKLQADQNNFFMPHNLEPNPIFIPQIVHPNPVFPYRTSSPHCKVDSTENRKQFDDKEVEVLSFSPNISDLEYSLWSY